MPHKQTATASPSSSTIAGAPATPDASQETPVDETSNGAESLMPMNIVGAIAATAIACSTLN